MAGFRGLEGVRVVITGANSGIGSSLLKFLKAEGCNIVAADINIHNIGESVRVHAVQVDISTKGGVDRLFDEATRILGGIDIFVANAGFPYYEAIRKADWDRVERIFAVNTLSPIYSYEKMVEHLEGRHGMVVITDSAMGETAMPGFSLYSSTKYALDGFRDGIRHEAPDNVDTVFVYPVSTDTGFFLHETTNGMQKPWPVQTPDRVAKAIVSGIRRGKRRVYPSRLYVVARVMFRACPPIEWGYCAFYRRKMRRRLGLGD